jgi:hypothetical protein
MKDDNYIPRPVRFLDLVVVGVGFIHNIASSIETLTGELMELAIYQSNHLTQTNRAWEDMATDLEKLEEDVYLEYWLAEHLT